MKHTDSRSRSLDFLFFGFVALIWSSSFMFVKIAVGSVPPVTMAAVRLLLGGILLFAYMRLVNEQLTGRLSDWLIFGFIGLVGNILPFVLIGFGEITIDSGTAAIMMGIMPVTTVVLAHWLVPDEPFTLRKMFGIGLGFGGLVVLVGIDAASGLDLTTVAQLAILAAAVCYAINTVFVRRVANLSGPSLAAGSQIAGCVLILPVCLWVDRPWTLEPTFDAVIAVLILSVFATAVATVLYFRLVKNLGAGVMSQVNYVIPVLGTLWGVIFLSEQPDSNDLVALVMVLAGVAIMSSAPRPGKAATS